MSLVIAVVALVAVTLLYTLFVRQSDIPAPDPVSPTRHLEEKRAAIYENLRDLQFEYRVGKLSDADYQQTKLALQKELAVVIGEIQQMVGAAGVATPALVAASATATATVSGALATRPAKGAYRLPSLRRGFSRRSEILRRMWKGDAMSFRSLALRRVSRSVAFFALPLLAIDGVVLNGTLERPQPGVEIRLSSRARKA